MFPLVINLQILFHVSGNTDILSLYGSAQRANFVCRSAKTKLEEHFNSFCVRIKIEGILFASKYCKVQNVYLFIALAVLLTAVPVNLGTGERSVLRAFK